MSLVSVKQPRYIQAVPAAQPSHAPLPAHLPAPRPAHPSAGSTDRTQLSWWWLAGCFFLLIDLKLLFALALPGPWFMPDETIYYWQARLLASGASPLAIGKYGGVQPGLPLLLAPIVALFADAPRLCYVLGVTVSSALATAGMVPVYLLARRRLAPWAALLTAILPAVLPGSCLLGWAVLTEPPYTLLLLCCAWAFWRGGGGAGGAGTKYWLVAALLAMATFVVRPFGLCALLAFAAGIAYWGWTTRQWRVPALILGGFAAVAALSVLARWAVTGQVLLTNYGSESFLRRTVLDALTTAAGLRRMGHAAAMDLAYLHVASFGIGVPFSLCALLAIAGRWRSSSAAARSVAVAMLVLLGSTLALAAIMRDIAVQDAMYGRYVEPLVGLLLTIGLLSAIAGRFSGRRLALLAVLLLAGAGLCLLADPGEGFSFANNAGYWYFALLKGITRVGAAGILLGIGSVLLLLRTRPVLPLVLLLLLALIASCLVALHIHRYNQSRQEFRQTIEAITLAVRNTHRTAGHLYIDPRLATSQDVARNLDYTLWLLRFELPRMEVEYANGQPAQPGDLLLTCVTPESATPLWTNGALAICPLP